MKNNFRIHFLNTIWSDAILIENNNHFALIDTGTDFYYPMIKKYLLDLNVKVLDFILLTHFHSDHYGNINNLINDFKIKKLYLKKYKGYESDIWDGLKTNKEYIKKQMKIADLFYDICKLNEVDLVFIDKRYKYINFNGQLLYLYNTENILEKLYYDKNSPFHLKKAFDENYNSIIIYIQINNHNVLLGADITDSNVDCPKVNLYAEQLIKKIYQDFKIDYIETFKIPHHGEKSCNPKSLANLTKSSYIVVTNTDKWLDNWDTCSYYLQSNKDAKIFKTDYYQYIFSYENNDLNIEKIDNVSLFISLNKN